MDYGKTNYELEIDDDTLVEETSLVAFAFLCTRMQDCNIERETLFPYMRLT